MYNRYIPKDTVYAPVNAGPASRTGGPHSGGGAPSSRGMRSGPARSPGSTPRPPLSSLSALLSGRGEGLGALFSRGERRGLSGALKALKLEEIDTGDILLLLIVLYLLVEGDDLELVIALGLVLLMGLGEKGEEERGQALPGEGPE